MALLGYGSLQSGVYLGAGVDLAATQELLAFYGLSATLFRAEHLGPKEEVLRAFSLKEASAHYQTLFSSVPPVLEDPLLAFRTLTRLVHEMRKLLFLDPLLPPELLPPGFPGPSARERFLTLRETLYRQAEPFLKRLSLSPLTPGGITFRG